MAWGTDGSRVERFPNPAVGKPCEATIGEYAEGSEGEVVWRKEPTLARKQKLPVPMGYAAEVVVADSLAGGYSSWEAEASPRREPVPLAQWAMLGTALVDPERTVNSVDSACARSSGV